MSKSGEVRKIMENLFSDGEVHTISEIVQIALDNNIITNTNDQAISNAIYQFKKINSDFQCVGKGKYQRKECGDSEDLMDLKERVNYILNEIKKIKRFDWINCENKEALLEKEKITMIKKIVKEFENMVK